jgi:pyruvate/2-oxoglutarate dehydrogenase complex dihydrolipoamide acyltransferase (E2) component
MATYVFNLPDLGEGLTEATVVEWNVSEGDAIERNAPLVEMDTTKAVVDVPSPVTGTVVKLHGKAGETLAVGAPLVTFETAEQAGIVGTVPGEHGSKRSVRLKPPGS